MIFAMQNKTNQANGITPSYGKNLRRVAKPLLCAVAMLLSLTTARAGYQLTTDSDGDGNLDWMDDSTYMMHDTGGVWPSCAAWYQAHFGTSLNAQQQWVLDTSAADNCSVSINASGNWTITDPNAGVMVNGGWWPSMAAYYHDEGWWGPDGTHWASPDAYQASLIPAPHPPATSVMSHRASRPIRMTRPILACRLTLTG